MNIDLELYRVFNAVARLGSFSAAAQKAAMRVPRV